MPDETQQAPKRKKKRFKDRESVIEAIDELERENKADRIEGEVMDAFADTIRDKFSDMRYIAWHLKIDEYRTKALRARNRADRRSEQRLPKLKKILAVVQTPVLSIEINGPDTSVEMY